MSIAAINCRDHNATSYSTETCERSADVPCPEAEIITLRAIALKLFNKRLRETMETGRDHNATSYSTETSISAVRLLVSLLQRS